MQRLIGALVGLWLLVGAVGTSAQTSAVPPSQVAAFIGTWVFAMTNPANSEQTIKIWNDNGVLAATLEVGKFPPRKITGIFKDGDMLVLTTTLRENGADIWAVIALTSEGDRLDLAQMMERSETIKRGTAQRR